jgi:hypothetical protein
MRDIRIKLERNSMRKTGLIFVSLVAAAATVQAMGKVSVNARHQAVLTLQPAGYWPADEGTGDVLHDRSGNGNHGRIHYAGWNGGFLNFTGVSQWAEIGSISNYATAEVSIGGWVYNRGVYDSPGVHLIGNGYRNTGITLKTLYDGKPIPAFGTPSDGVSLTLPKNSISVYCGNQKDAVRSVEKGVFWDVNKWEHVLFTFAGGVGKLYLNGELVREQSGLSYQWNGMPLVVGIQADKASVNQWWNLSLDGQVADLVLFTRALNGAEVRQLAAQTPPAVSFVQPAQPEKKQAAAVEVKSVPQLITEIHNPGEAVQLAAVRALAEMKSAAKPAVPELIHLLQRIIDREGAHLLRSNELLRNALIWALQEIDPADPKARELLGTALAKPLFDSFDLKDPFFDELRPLIKEGRYMDALDVYRKLPLKEAVTVTKNGELPYAGQVNMKGDIHYTPMVHYKGSTYIAGVAWVSKEELAGLPQAADWKEADDEWPARVVITKIDPDGKQTTVALEGDGFILSSSDTKMHGWSLGVDRDGYLHLIGGMHNIVMPERYISGSFEKLGLSREYEDENFPNVMYWVSEKPGDITSFKFMGRRDNPRTIPVLQGLNYMSIEQDRLGNLYVFGRIYSQGMQAFALCRYDPDVKRWKNLGGFAPDMKKEDPSWANLQIMSGDVGLNRSLMVEADNPRTKAIFWDKGTSWYGFSRGSLRFDKQNRMHFTVPLRSIGPDGIMVSQALYAYSDDLGDTFHRADGTPVQSLPMGGVPGPHQADVLGEAGSTIVYFDANGIPGVFGAGGETTVYWHTGLGKWQSFKPPLGGLSNVFPDSRGIITWRSEGGEKMWRSAGHGMNGKMHAISELPFDKGKRNYTSNTDWREIYDNGNWVSVQVRYKERVVHPSMFDIKFEHKAQ